jgi:heptosyltransferase II
MSLASPPLFDPPPRLERGARPGGAPNVAVVQPLPGIGDMIWHLPHLHALAAAAGRAVTLIAKPRSAADQLLGADPAVRDIIWLDRNPQGQRRGRHDGLRGLLRLAGAAI